MDSADDTDHLTAQRWVTGKDAVTAIKSFALGQGKHAIVVKKGGTFRHLTCSSAPACKWFINLSRYRSKEGSGDWHVSNAKWEHQNCMGVAKPTQHEIADHPVVRSSVISNTDVPAKVLVTQLRHQAGLTCSTTMIYRAKCKINAEIFARVNAPLTQRRVDVAGPICGAAPGPTYNVSDPKEYSYTTITSSHR